MIDFQVTFTNKNLQEKYQTYLETHRSILEMVLDDQETFSDSLGWFFIDKWANQTTLSHIKALAEKVSNDAEVFVLIGVGGSNNAARAVIKALQTDGPEIIYAGNTLSPYQLHKVLKALDGKSVYLHCIAKNFETLEPGSSFRFLRQYLIDRYGEKEAARRIIATGTPGASLEHLCQEQGYDFLVFPEDVGGRFTALSSVGLFPMAVAGIDIVELVRGARAMQEQLHTNRSTANVAYAYAAYRQCSYQNGYGVEMLASFEPQFRWFHKWWLQLFGESEGKDNKGILPTFAEYTEDLHAIGQFVQEGSPILFETFLAVKEANASLWVSADSKGDGFDYLDGKDFWQINQVAFEATLSAHSQKLPCGLITMGALDAYHFGQLFYFFAFACYLSCQLIGVNPFDQPGVEAYKTLMFERLGKPS
ncbi:glucose-6-phosphate isomerase [Streptococcus plurextorum]|uniref:glucose-6-phosphate isomerase n=1 Tax=Streptococcus plurextorum TaxID=456876 RepID=UPI000426BF81|nr:glucose-6-phosphate isomerase [Streptococcus plurextorum]